jgi:hypothetical protein
VPDLEHNIPMKGLFISYRREESGPYAGRLYDIAVRHFGADRVFLDVSSVQPGHDFREAIEHACSSCECLLAVVGKHWATVRDNSGALRLDSESDYVRLELSLALQKNLLVIPVLINGAELPPEGSLPPDIRPLVYRNAWHLSDLRFHDDVQQLVNAIKGTVEGRSSLFPLYGVTLGTTTISELSRQFARTKVISDSTGQPYHCYVWYGPRSEFDFWYDDDSGIVTGMYITSTSTFPEPWQDLGFRWLNSYDEWIAVLSYMGYVITIKEAPHVERYDGHDSFRAEVIGRANTTPPLQIELSFRFSRRTTRTSPETLYSLGVKAS